VPVAGRFTLDTKLLYSEHGSSDCQPSNNLKTDLLIIRLVMLREKEAVKAQCETSCQDIRQMRGNVLIVFVSVLLLGIHMSCEIDNVHDQLRQPDCYYSKKRCQIIASLFESR